MGKAKTAPHPTSIAVWGVPSPVVVNRRFTARVGVKCSAGCPLAGRTVSVRDATGTDVGRARLGERPEAGTNALYAAEVTLEAPAEEGMHAWTAACDDPAAPAQEPPPAFAEASQPGVAHAGATATFGFRTVSPPEHRVTVSVLDRNTEAPLAGAEVRVGVYRGTTDASGQAQIEVQAGSYDLYVRKVGYAPHTQGLQVSADVHRRVVAVPVAEVDPDDEQIWM